MDSIGIYIHIPFCAHKCPYCDFNAYSGLGGLASRYTDALCREIRSSPWLDRSVTSISFGGGTPTFLSGRQLSDILSTIRDSFTVYNGAEISSEANPTSVDSSKYEAMRSAGFNRISIGVQSFEDRFLRILEREHSSAEAQEAYITARSAGFDNISLDLMFGLPRQTSDDWNQTLDTAIQLAPEHVSTYSLTIEPGTRFERLNAGGKLPLPHEDQELEMYETAIDRLERSGLYHYEVSNFARKGREARHNLIYWRNGEYLGFGAGAVSYMDGERWTNEKFPERYIRSVEEGKGLAVESEKLDRINSLAETLTQGLRLRNGIDLAALSERYGVDVERMYRPKLDALEGRGLIAIAHTDIRLTHRGLLLANDVFLELLPD